VTGSLAPHSHLDGDPPRPSPRAPVRRQRQGWPRHTRPDRRSERPRWPIFASTQPTRPQQRTAIGRVSPY
jgi:hypothetical protein